MLDESTQPEEAQRDQQPTDESKVTCFVCKRGVEREQALRIHHSKKQQVWVCQAHIK